MASAWQVSLIPNPGPAGPLFCMATCGHFGDRGLSPHPRLAAASRVGPQPCSCLGTATRLQEIPPVRPRVLAWVVCRAAGAALPCNLLRAPLGKCTPEEITQIGHGYRQMRCLQQLIYQGSCQELRGKTVLGDDLLVYEALRRRDLVILGGPLK